MSLNKNVMYTPNEIKHIIISYAWKKNLIDENIYAGDYDSTSVSQYGIESTMPQAQGETGDKVLVRVLRNDKQNRRLLKLIDEVAFIDEYEECVVNEKNYHILQLLKQGHTKRKVKELMKIGNDTLDKRIKDIVGVYIEQQIKAYQHK
ncbi:hypothetical protein [Macrococcoides bohemicum]|uniref:hypothetical protein n=1 Tax=Macrococcoides bohemicum TaxID=1903056 RepID=UPI001F10F235|nr:hypothetical protein [Macrococcus bohemicus]